MVKQLRQFLIGLCALFLGAVPAAAGTSVSGPIPGWTQIGAPITAAGAASYAFTGIPSTYTDLLVVFTNVGGSTAQAIQMAVGNTVPTYTTANNVITVTNNAYGTIYLPLSPGRTTGGAYVAMVDGNGLNSQATNIGYAWNRSGGLAAIQFSVTAGTILSGTITLYGR